MKKSQLKQLLREVIEESSMSRLHQEISDSIEMLIEAGATYQDIIDVATEMEKASQEEPEETYDASGKKSTVGSFDVAGKYNGQKDAERAEYEQDR